MNLKECQDWTAAAGQCLPQARTARLKEAAAKVESLGGPGRWEIGLESAPRLEKATLRYFALQPEGAAAARLARHWVKDTRPKAAAEGFPTLTLEWSLQKDELSRAWVYGAGTGGKADARSSDGISTRLAAQAFSKSWLSDPTIAALLGDFSALCPAQALLLEWRAGPDGSWKQSPRWGLSLRRPEAWPQFARFGLADPFLPHSTMLAYLMEERRVREVWFEGGALAVSLGA